MNDDDGEAEGNIDDTTRSGSEREAEPTRPGARAADHTPTDTGTTAEPVATGTLFIVVLFLMALAGLWAILYLDLLQR